MVRCASDHSILWLQEILPTEFPAARILTFGYDVLAATTAGHGALSLSQKDTAPNKIFGKSKQWRVTAGLQCFLQLLDKRGKKDWTLQDKGKQKRPKYHFTDAHGSRISEDHIWFT